MSGMLEIAGIALIAFMFVYLGKPGMMFSWYQRLIDRLPWDWLWKPLGGCLKCFTGQCLFWYYIFFVDGYNFFEHMFYVSFGILCSMVYDKLTDFLDGTEED